MGGRQTIETARGRRLTKNMKRNQFPAGPLFGAVRVFGAGRSRDHGVVRSGALPRRVPAKVTAPGDSQRSQGQHVRCGAAVRRLLPFDGRLDAVHQEDQRRQQSLATPRLLSSTTERLHGSRGH